MPDARMMAPAMTDPDPSVPGYRPAAAADPSAHATRDVSVPATFWAVVAAAVLATLLLYCWPASERIGRQTEALAEARQGLQAAQEQCDRLEDECRALDDPFYVERLLRFEHNWQPVTDRR